MAYESTGRRRALLATAEQSAQFKAATLSWLADLAPAAPTEDDVTITDNGRALNATVLVRSQADLESVSSKLSGAGFLAAVQQAFAGEQVQFLSPAVVTTDVRQELAPPPPLPASPPPPPSLPPRPSPPTPPSPPSAPPCPPAPLAPPPLPPKISSPLLPPKQSAQAPPPSPRLPPASPKAKQLATLEPEEDGSNQLIEAEDTRIGLAGGGGGLALLLLAALCYCWRSSRSRKALLQAQRVVAIAAGGDGPDRSQGIAKAHSLLDRASRQSRSGNKVRRQRTLPTNCASVNGASLSEKADLEVCHSFFNKNGSTQNGRPQNGGPQDDGPQNGDAKNGGAQNGGDRAWRSFAPDKAEADAIVALCASPTDKSLEGADAPAGAQARASPKLSAATDVLIKMLAEEKNGVEPMKLPPPVYDASSSATHLARSQPMSLVQGGADGAAVGRAKRAPSSVGNMINQFEVQIDQSKPPPPPQPETGAKGSTAEGDARPHSPTADLLASSPDLVRSLSKPVSKPVSGEGALMSHGGAKALLRARLSSESKKAAMLWVEGEQNRWLEEEGNNSPSVEGQDSPRADGKDSPGDGPGRKHSSGNGAPLGRRGSPETAERAAHDAAVAIESLDTDSLQTLLQAQPRSSSSGGPSLISKLAAAGGRRHASFERRKRREMGGDATAPPPTDSAARALSRQPDPRGRHRRVRLFVQLHREKATLNM